MKTSLIDFYNKLGVNYKSDTLIPNLERIDGQYRGFFNTNFIVMTHMNAYIQAEEANQLIEEDSTFWCPAILVETLFNIKDEEDEDFVKNGLDVAVSKGWLIFKTIDDESYFTISEKLLDEELYKSE